MEERDHGSGPAFEGPAFEPTPEDIGRAAAEAAALATAPVAPAPARGPRRWLVPAGVAVAALALAGTAVAVATGGSHKGGDTTESAAAAQTAVTSSGSDTPTSGTPGGTSTTGSSAQDSTSSSSSSPTPQKPATTSTSKPSASKSSSPAPPAGTDEEGGDCENTSHSTQQDDAAKFSGMNKGAQHAFLAAQAAAKSAGVSSFVLNSGYRSAAYQKRIFECWVNQLGSPEAARKYALPPNESAHVLGYAMDIAPPTAASWLENTKGQFGLCRRYADETWHFEFQYSYKTKGCPALLPHP